MNIVNKLTLRHLKANGKRTVVTVIGIIISVAMVTAVFTSAISFMDFMQNVEIAYGGSWHSCFGLCTQEDVKKLEADAGVKTVAVKQLGTQTDVDLKNKNEKTETDLCGVNAAFYEVFNIKLTQGRTPMQPGEIVAAQSFIDENELGWKVGETVTVNTWDGDKVAYVPKRFTLVGITDADNRQTRTSALMTVLESGSGHDLIVYVVNEKLNNGIWETTAAQAKSIGRKDADDYHSDLLAYSGIFRDNAMLASIGGFAAVILIIIMIASVFMIYNSFAVSFQQRSRYLGMLASVGATKRQKRRSVYFEGCILGLIGIPIGIVSGIGGIAVTFRCVSDMMLSAFGIPVDRPLRVSANWLIIAMSVVISVLTIFISSLIPARRASKTAPIDAIRQTNTVKTKSRKLKTSKLTGSIFGYEGQLATKNYKRNGKRSRTITSALALSVILFLAVTSFSGAFSQLIGSNYGGTSADIYITCAANNAKKVETKLSEMKTVEGFTRLSVSSNIVLKDSGLYLNETGEKYADNYDFSNLYVYGMDRSDFEAYCKKVGTDSAEYTDSASPKMILVNRTTVRNVDGKKKLSVVPYADITGKKLSLSYTDGSAKKASCFAVVGAVTDKEASQDMAFFESAYLVMPLDTILTVFDGAKSSVQITYAIKAEKHAEAYEELDEYLSDNAIDNQSFDAIKQLASVKAIVTVGNVFAYGFITLITLISAANIVNTISTSMEERRREFAMIKSVGLTPKGFKKMIYFESVYYGIRSLLWGLPLGFAVNYLLYRMLSKTYDFGFSVQWRYYFIAVAAVFLIVSMALLYSMTKIKKDSIIETLKNEDT